MLVYGKHGRLELIPGLYENKTPHDLWYTAEHTYKKGFYWTLYHDHTKEGAFFPVGLFVVLIDSISLSNTNKDIVFWFLKNEKIYQSKVDLNQIKEKKFNCLVPI